MALSKSSAASFLPTRSSVLTRLLFSKPVDRCILIACVSPDRHLVSETISTLDFASAGLYVQHWGGAGHRERTMSETELLRFALNKLKRELAAEKFKRKQLEKEISARSISFKSRFDGGESSDNDRSPLMKTAGFGKHDKKSFKVSFMDESTRLTPILPKMRAGNSLETSRRFDESVLSQAWRHDQYDAILQRCWGNSV